MTYESSTPSHNPNIAVHGLLQARATESDQGGTGSTIALALTCGALFITTVGFAYAMCRWRIKYMAMRRKVDSHGVIELKPGQKQDAVPRAQEADGDPAPGTPGLDGEAAVSGAL
ncbi:uncharacterized protein HRG_06179 [Hirsutella rhossiliensis]|uniref:Uncharacterized protein n=1 Tax=Hirsutella rhossiliensis TaxID=111463 RepID=A0A9P8MYQ0_9HYPO|nr:uncharacterized protein HRG_06179 [Hirsutella rhossiliensis]KAH0963669.1 hypothetical protein HRG_06179 [Hirsutella rhossiliensis]